jgi:hypothetical protein
LICFQNATYGCESDRNRKTVGWREKSARGLAHSTTLAPGTSAPCARSVLECGGPPPLYCHGRLLMSGFTFYPPARRHGEVLVGKTSVWPQRQRAGALQDAGANFEGSAGAQRPEVRAALRRFDRMHSRNSPAYLYKPDSLSFFRGALTRHWFKTPQAGHCELDAGLTTGRRAD